MMETEEELKEETLLSHLIELRSRLLKMGASILVVFLVLAPFSDFIFRSIALPLMEQLPEGSTMIATQVASPFLTPFKTTMFAALFLSMPVVLYQVWGFTAPGLYKKEKRFAVPLLLSSIVLFYCGTVFAYLVVFPLMFAFFTSAAPTGVAVMTDIASYLDFVLVLFFAFGIAFEVPIATVVLVWSGFNFSGDSGKEQSIRFFGSFCCWYAHNTTRCYFSNTIGCTSLFTL